MSATSRLPLGACVRGFTAWQFALLLREPLKRRIAELEQSAQDETVWTLPGLGGGSAHAIRIR